MCVNLKTYVGNGLVFPIPSPIFDWISPNELQLPEEEQVVFSVSSERYREMGLICVPLTERERELKDAVRP